MVILNSKYTSLCLGRKEVMIYAASGKQAGFEIAISLSVPVLVDMYMCCVG